MTKHLDRLFRPKTIAVVGGGAWCRNVVTKCAEMGFAGAVWPVHPTKSEIGGKRAFADLSELPSAPDAVFIGVNRHATVDIVMQLRDMGAGGAVCFANGFREAKGEMADGANLQDRLLEAAGDMTIIGPNCYGFINYLDGALLWPDQHGGKPAESGVAIVTQSSNIAINLTMQQRALPIAYIATVGNQAQTGFADVGMALLEDPRVTALGLHIEGVGDLRKFELLAEMAHELGKPIIAIKAGRSEQARAATVSHTASIAGSDAGSRALFRRLGVGQVESLPIFIEALKLLHIAGPLPGHNIASMSCSGGEASLMADAIIETVLNFPELTDAQSDGLRRALGPSVSLANPLDYNTHIWPDSDAIAATFTALAAPNIAFSMIVSDFPRGDRCNTTDWDCVIMAAKATRQVTGRAVGVVTTLAENLPEDVAETLALAGVVPCFGIDDTLMAVAVAADLCGSKNVRAEPVLLPAQPTKPAVISENAAKSELSAYGVPVPNGVQVSGMNALKEAAKSLHNPFVIKGVGLSHKSEHGAVAVGLRDIEAVIAAATKMHGDTFLLEEMVADCIAELLVGVVLDPAHGYVLTLGAGGTLTELLGDTRSLLVPASGDAVRQELECLKIYPVLTGYRGGMAANIDAIVDAVMKLQTYVIDNHGRVQEVEINPLMCGTKQAVAADALILAGEPDET